MLLNLPNAFTISQIKDAVITEKWSGSMIQGQCTQMDSSHVLIWKKKKKDNDNDNDIYFKIPHLFI